MQVICHVQRENLGDYLRTQIPHDHKIRDARSNQVANDAQLHQQLAGSTESMETEHLEAPPTCQQRGFNKIVAANPGYSIA